MNINKDKLEEILKKLWKEDDGCVSLERISYNKALQDIQYEIDKLEINEKQSYNGINKVLENSQKADFEKSADNTNKVEPKFKVGDWVIINNDKIDLNLVSFDYLDLNSPLLITDFGVDGQHYEVEDVNGKSDYPRMEYIENRYHLWTLEDAKDGDVLVHSKPTSDDFDYIFIYNKTSLLQAYCYYSKKKDRAFVEDRSHYCPWNMDEVIMPATKKQRDFLRSRLGEIHFEWDGKNKILSHID